jgi:hypothetical protein
MIPPPSPDARPALPDPDPLKKVENTTYSVNSKSSLSMTKRTMIFLTMMMVIIVLRARK